MKGGWKKRQNIMMISATKEFEDELFQRGRTGSHHGLDRAVQHSRNLYAVGTYKHISKWCTATVERLHPKDPFGLFGAGGTAQLVTYIRNVLYIKSSYKSTPKPRECRTHGIIISEIIPMP